MQTASKSQVISNLVEILPEQEQTLAYEFIKRMVLAWDSDYTKLTPFERSRSEQAEYEFAQGDTIAHHEIDWD